MVLRKTIRKLLAAKCREIRRQIKRRMHDPIPKLGRWLRSVVIGYQNYWAVLGNMDAVHAFRDEVVKAPKHALFRRSQKGKRLNWGGFLVPETTGFHKLGLHIPFHGSGLTRNTRGRSRMRENHHVRICTGSAGQNRHSYRDPQAPGQGTDEHGHEDKTDDCVAQAKP